MINNIKVPSVGESIKEGVLVEWLIADGAVVAADQPLFELETDKITMPVSAGFAGRVKIGDVKNGDKVLIGQVVGMVDTDAKAAAPVVSAPVVAPVAPPAATSHVARPESNGGETLAPSVRRLVTENALDPAAISGTGRAGRITKGDVLQHMDRGAATLVAEPQATLVAEPQATEVAPPASPVEPRTSHVAPPPPVAPRPSNVERQTRHPMSSLRAKIAERLVASQHQSATLTTFNECDMTNLMAMRARHQDAFMKKHGIKLGVMSFFVKAAVEGLKAIPAVNQQIDGTDLIENHFYDIGVAVSTEKGLVVPVVRDADLKSFAQLEVEIADLGKRAHDRKLTLDELQGGVFTVSNGGVFGSLLSTPILNPPQAAILGMHGIKKRAMAMPPDDRLEVRPMMYLAVSYDHRVIDGAQSVMFLRRIVDCIENPERIMLEV